MVTGVKLSAGDQQVILWLECKHSDTTVLQASTYSLQLEEDSGQLTGLDPQ